MGRRPRIEIEKFARDRFNLLRDDILAEYERKRRHLLKHERRTGNCGGYVPAVTTWGAERARKMILARADAYVDAFTLYGVPSDARAETSLREAAEQEVAGTVSAIRGGLELRARRLRVVEEGRGMPWHLEIERAMKAATKEGVLKLRQQRIESTQVRLTTPAGNDNLGTKAGPHAAGQGRREGVQNSMKMPEKASPANLDKRNLALLRGTDGQWKRAVTLDAAARYGGVGRRAIEKAARKGSLESEGDGPNRRILVESLLRYYPPESIAN